MKKTYEGRRGKGTYFPCPPTPSLADVILHLHPHLNTGLNQFQMGKGEEKNLLSSSLPPHLESRVVVGEGTWGGGGEQAQVFLKPTSPVTIQDEPCGCLWRAMAGGTHATQGEEKGVEMATR